jgi:hypothetical protein
MVKISPTQIGFIVLFVIGGFFGWLLGTWMHTPSRLMLAKGETWPTRLKNVVATSCLLDECLKKGISFPVETLPAVSRVALINVALEEYRLRALYQAAVTQFGQQQPFVMGLRSEEQSETLVKSLFDKYGEAPASDPWLNQKSSVTSTGDGTCTMLNEEEMRRLKINEESLLAFDAYPDIQRAVREIQDAAKYTHLPALEECLKK